MHLTIHVDSRDDIPALLSALDPRDNTPQLELDLGTDQACDAFMEEREALKAELADIYSTLTRAARFVEASRRLLDGIGVRIDTKEDGTPGLSLDVDQLLNTVELFAPER